jgi:hypothetical protein
MLKVNYVVVTIAEKDKQKTGGLKPPVIWSPELSLFEKVAVSSARPRRA